MCVPMLLLSCQKQLCACFIMLINTCTCIFVYIISEAKEDNLFFPGICIFYRIYVSVKLMKG